MKRLFIILALLGTCSGLCAQSADSTATSDSLWWDTHPRWRLDLGLSAGVTLFSTDNETSPYYSTLGLTLQVPLMLSHYVSPHWRLSTGVRLDFNINPLHYNVERYLSSEPPYNEGIDFATTNEKQWSYTYFAYLGIPLQATWYPWPRERGVLSVTADLFAGYALGRRIVINTYAVDSDRSGFSEGQDIIAGDGTLLPWKLEMGVTVSTDVLGLLHGVRFFVNLLPSYRDPVTGDGLYLHGMTLFL